MRLTSTTVSEGASLLIGAHSVLIERPEKEYVLITCDPREAAVARRLVDEPGTVEATVAEEAGLDPARSRMILDESQYLALLEDVCQGRPSGLCFLRVGRKVRASFTP